MKLALLEFLRCPKTAEKLTLMVDEQIGDEITFGSLVNPVSGEIFPIHEGIPRFVPKSNYADNFGLQWNHFRETQLDSCSKLPISNDRFWSATSWNPSDLKDNWVLDAGSGAGRFAEIALEAGAKVIALDFSSAVDACYKNLRHHPNLHVVQGDIYSLPFAEASFPFVYSLGVLQHTPDVEKAFRCLPKMVAPGGRLCADFYWKRLRTMLHSKYIVRPITKRISDAKVFEFLERRIGLLLRVSQLLGSIPLVGRGLMRIIPIADYTGIYPLDEKTLLEWTLLDTFDMWAPEYDNPQTARTVRRWFESEGFLQVEVGHWSHLVGRGKNPR